LVWHSIVVIFLFGWPWWRRVRFTIGWMVGNSKIAEFEISGDGTRF
jgi:hypothetical protein